MGWVGRVEKNDDFPYLNQPYLKCSTQQNSPFFNSLTSIRVFTRIVSDNLWFSLLAICSLRWKYNVTVTHCIPNHQLWYANQSTWTFGSLSCDMLTSPHELLGPSVVICLPVHMNVCLKKCMTMFKIYKLCPNFYK